MTMMTINSRLTEGEIINFRPGATIRSSLQASIRQGGLGFYAFSHWGPDPDALTKSGARFSHLALLWS